MFSKQKFNIFPNAILGLETASRTDEMFAQEPSRSFSVTHPPLHRVWFNSNSNPKPSPKPREGWVISLPKTGIDPLGQGDCFQNLLGTGADLQARSSYMREILTQEEYDALCIDILKPLSVFELILVRSKCQSYDIHKIPASLINNNSLESYVCWKQLLSKAN